MKIIDLLVDEFKLNIKIVQNVVNLIDEGNTIPFIARYRKELTDSLDDVILRDLYTRLLYLRNLEEKREQTKNLILELEKLTPEIEKALQKAKTLAEIEDIYRPFRQKKRTRATIAKDKGLEPLANIIFTKNKSEDEILEIATEFITDEVENEQGAVEFAKDIIAENISDNARYRAIVRREFLNNSIICTNVKDDTIKSVYEMYYNFKEAVKKITGYRVLAINRGEKENVLNVKIEEETEDILRKLEFEIKKTNSFNTYVDEAMQDSYKRLIKPSIEREIRNLLTEKAEEDAIKVFSKNLKQLLLQPPIKDKIVLAIDPGFRNGCKIAVIDGVGKVLNTFVVYPTDTKNIEKINNAKKTIQDNILKFNVDIIAIGNGTASRESEIFVVDLIKEMDKKIYYIIVNEAGASIYSASKLASEEFPEYDVSVRSAINIGRRLQDPLAELVKIDPKGIGVGQYQHDMNEKKLGQSLSGVVEGAVTSVGVDLNTASSELLNYISGITKNISKNIILYREENGKFRNRKELLKVKGLGPKAYLQCAGFLRITDGNELLDNTAVHPESYKDTLKFLEKTNTTIGHIPKDINMDSIANEIGIGVPTLTDIIKELEKPGRDIREDIDPPILRSDVLDLKDLTVGMILKGTVRNVIDFGAFVDIGVHQDGLLHISQISDRFIKHPLEVLNVSDIINVKIIAVDLEKKKFSLSMKI